jgi:hypothetical protein
MICTNLGKNLAAVAGLESPNKERWKESQIKSNITSYVLYE